MAKILLIEDNEMNRDMLSRRLIKRGYEVVVAVDGREGVDKAQGGEPRPRPHGHEPPRARRLGGDAGAPGGSCHAVDPGDRAHRSRHGRGPGEGARGGLRRLRYEADRARAASRKDRGAPRGDDARVPIARAPRALFRPATCRRLSIGGEGGWRKTQRVDDPGSGQPGAPPPRAPDAAEPRARLQRDAARGRGRFGRACGGAPAMSAARAGRSSLSWRSLSLATRVETTGVDLDRFAAALSGPLDRLGGAVELLAALASECGPAVSADAERISGAVARLRSLVGTWTPKPGDWRGGSFCPRSGRGGSAGASSHRPGARVHDPGRRRQRGEPPAAGPAAHSRGSPRAHRGRRPRRVRPPPGRAGRPGPSGRDDARPGRSRGAGAAQAGSGATPHPGAR